MFASHNYLIKLLNNIKILNLIFEILKSQALLKNCLISRLFVFQIKVCVAVTASRRSTIRRLAHGGPLYF